MTGLGPDGVAVLAAYVDVTADVQTVAAVAAVALNALDPLSPRPLRLTLRVRGGTL